MNSTVIAPTKSLCRSGGGRTRVAIRRQQQQRQRQQYHNKAAMRKINTPGLITTRAKGNNNNNNNNNNKSRFVSSLASPSTISMTRTMTMTMTRSLPMIRAASSLSSNATRTQSSSNNNNNATATMAMAMAAAAAFLGGTYHQQQQRRHRAQENGMTNKQAETASSTVTTLPESVVASVETITSPVPTTRTRTTSSYYLPIISPPVSHNNDHNNSHDSSEAGTTNNTRSSTTNNYRRLFFDDIIAEIKTAAGAGANTSIMEPLRRQAVKNPISHSQFHQQPRNVMISRMRSVAGRGLHEKYKVDWKTVLGEGAYGSVHPARLALTGEKVALKKISKRYTNSSDFFTETDALLRIYDNGGHPNISGLRDMYEDYQHFYLVMDLITGGELFDHLSNDGAYSEADAARLIFEISSALAFMHGVGVIHCDIKPENLMLCSRKRRGGTIKIIDFGCALTLPVGHYDASGSHVGGIDSDDNDSDSDKNNNNERDSDDGDDDNDSSTNSGSDPEGPIETGTTGYWPPERFEGQKLTPAVDTWALGIILYIMLMGFHPFDVNCDRSDEEVAEAIQKNPLPPMDDVYVGHLSESAKDLICRLMEPDPIKRMTAYQLMHHPWVQGETATTEKIEDSDKRLSKFQDLRYKLEASVFAVLVNQGHPTLTMSEAKRRNTVTKNGSSGVSIMKSVFDVFDEGGKGYVTGEDIGKLVTEHTGEVLKTHDANEFLKVGNQDSELSLSNFSNLFSGMKHKHFPRGHYIFHAGDEGRSMYFLSSGKVEVQTRKGQLVAILRNGDFFGEGSLLDENKKRFTTAKCATPVDVIEINRADFDRYTRSSVDTKNELKRKWRARSLVYAKNLVRFEQSLKSRSLSKGDVVYQEGDKGTAMYRVDDLKGGELEVLHGDVPVHKYVAGDSFGESSLLFDKPRSSTVRCVSDNCHIHEMSGEDFMAVVQSSPDSADSLRNMCRKRLFKRAVKQFSLETNRGLSDDDIVAAFHNADEDNSGCLSVEDVRRIMHRMDPKFPMSEIHQLMKFVDVDEDGQVDLHEFKQIFRQFEDEKS